MDWLKGVAGKVATGLIFLAVGIAGLAWYQADAATRSAVVGGIGMAIGWAVAVVVVPWAGFWLIGRVARAQSNAAGACLVAGLTLIEAAALYWLFQPASGAAWGLAVAAVLIACVYNVLACDWIAEQVES